MELELKNRILACIPAALREAIAAEATPLSDMDLLMIAWEAAADYEQRLSLLRDLAEQAEDAAGEHARKLADLQEQRREAFYAAEDHTVYELAIRVGADFSTEQYLCADMDAVAEQIAQFWDDVADLGPNWVETDETSYKITKRRVHTAGAPFAEDAVGWAYLRPGTRLYRVELAERSFCEYQNCADCEMTCVFNHALSLPCIAEHGRPVRYLGRDGAERFGAVLLDWSDGPTEEYYIIPLICSQMKEHRFDEVYWAHVHISVLLAEPVEPDALPEQQRKDWEAFYAFLQEMQRTATDENQKRRYFP